MQIEHLFLRFLFTDFNISNIFYKIQKLNKWQLVSVITHWTYTCLNPWALWKLSLNLLFGDILFNGGVRCGQMASDVIKNTIFPDRQPRKGNNGISFEGNSSRQYCKYGTEHFKHLI